jgi:hypothetical protein
MRIRLYGKAYASSTPLTPFAQQCGYPVPILQVFTQRYKDDHRASKHNTVRSGTVEYTFHMVDQALTKLGATHTHNDTFGEIDFRIAHQFHC